MFAARFVQTNARLAGLAGNFMRTPARSMNALSIASLEARWPKLPEGEQGAIAETIYAKERGDWKKMTLEEKRASYFIAYGAYGARTPRNPAHKYRVFGWVSFVFLVSCGLWQMWLNAMRPVLVTETPEWKAIQAQNEIDRKMNPFQDGPYAKERAKTLAIAAAEKKE